MIPINSEINTIQANSLRQSIPGVDIYVTVMLTNDEGCNRRRTIAINSKIRQQTSKLRALNPFTVHSLIFRLLKSLQVYLQIRPFEGLMKTEVIDEEKQKEDPLVIS